MPEIKIPNPNNLPTVKLSELTVAQGYLKDLTEENYTKLKNSILKHGFIFPFAVWTNPEDGTKHILDGTQRQRVLTKENWDFDYPYIEIPAKTLKEATEILLKIASQYGTISQEGIDAYFATYELEETVMDEITFDQLRYLESQEADTEVEEDEAPPVADVAVSKLGEVYQLGKHRVMCGSADLEDDTNLLLGEAKIDLYLTDPPYNVDYTGKTKDALKMQNDKIDDIEFRAFLGDSFRRADEHMKNGASFYIFHADSEGFNFRAAVRDVGWLMKQTLIWIKQSMVMGRQDYQWQHEPILYGWKAGASHAWYSDRRQTTTLSFDRPSSSQDHPTMKPIDILAYLIRNNSKAGDIVFDNFLGSGSSLIACEQLDRGCYGMELDPRYCDVIRKRYWRFTHDNKEEGWADGTAKIN